MMSEPTNVKRKTTTTECFEGEIPGPKGSSKASTVFMEWKDGKLTTAIVIVRPDVGREREIDLREEGPVVARALEVLQAEALRVGEQSGLPKPCTDSEEGRRGGRRDRRGRRGT